MVWWLVTAPLVSQYLTEREKTRREEAQLEAETRDRADARATELKKTREECRTQTELAKMGIEQERIKANTQIELEENKQRHEKYLNDQATRQLNNIADQTRELNNMQLRLQAEANEADRVAREDDERLDQKKYEERMERVKAIEQEHNQMMQQKEKQLEQIRAEAHMDKKKAEEDYEQEKEWQEELVKNMKKEHKEQRERMEKEIDAAIARREEHGDKMIENLKEQERQMIQIHVEQRNALYHLMKKDSEDYQRRMGELNDKLAAIEKDHTKIINEIRDGRKAIETGKEQLDAVQRQFIEEQRKTISEIADGFSQHNKNDVFNQIINRSQTNSDKIGRHISSIENAHTVLKMIKDSGNTEKINQKMNGIEYLGEALVDEVTRSQELLKTDLRTLNTIAIDQKLVDEAKAILQRADAIYLSIFTAQAKLIPSMITDDLIKQMIGYRDDLNKNFENLPRPQDALEDIKERVKAEATKSTVSMTHQMQYATIKDVQNAAIAQNAAIVQNMQTHQLAPPDPHNPAPA
ncbi:hypothetical protein WR25_18745 [Diploscapter pachys]|uniref:Uncharacterized protein n=1 Tax=Diploscapter pachys TaxID=2018661 RepID=A0A2A2KSP4_9BILA|nr:hypothetical protein WR25_18745 [Diploscapter pachys]